MNKNIHPNCLGNIYNDEWRTGLTGNVYSAENIAATIRSRDEHQMIIESICVAMRGRNPENPKSRESGLPTEQMLEPNLNGTTNALTTVQKDNLILIKQARQQNNELYRIERQAIETMFNNDCEPGDTINPFNQRVDKSGVCPTITTRPEGMKTAILPITAEYRIRKLTPKECFRLMGVDDEDADKMIAVNSNTQCYKQAGNSIVVDVLAAMFAKLF